MTKKKQNVSYRDTTLDDLIGQGIQYRAPAVDQPAPDEAPRDRSLLRTAGDYGISALKGAIGVPEAAVGLADLATAGRAGKALEAIGFRPKEAKAILDEQYSEQQKQAFKEVQDAQGFVPTVAAMVQNPSTIVHSAVESAPSMLLGGGISRGIMAAAPRVGAIAAGAAGEGAVAAGQNAEQVRQEDPNGTLTPGQSAILAASGALTGGLGLAAGKVANRLGIGDIETMLAQGKLGAAGADAAEAGAKKGIVRKAAEGFGTEGVLQELPQSYQEQVAQNLAQGKPWDEGAAAAGAQGLMAGGFMGGMSGPLEGGHSAAPEANQGTPVPAPAQAAPLALAAPTITVGADGTAKTAEQRTATAQPRFSDITQVPGAGDVVDVPSRMVQERGALSRAANAVEPVATAAPGPLSRAAGSAEPTPTPAIEAPTQVNTAQAAINLGVNDAGSQDQAPAAVASPNIPGQGGAVISDTGTPAANTAAPGGAVAPRSAQPAPVRADAVSQQPAEVATPVFPSYEAADAYRKEQKARGANVQALPVPTEGGFKLAMKGAPEYAAGEALREDRRAAKERADAGILDGDILNKLGKPFSIRLPALNAAKANPGFEVVPVQGGFVARKAAATETQAKETPTDVPQSAKVAEETSQAPGAQAAEEKPAAVGVDAPSHFGRDNIPLPEGGKPFKVRQQADAAKKLQPQMRVVKVAGGFALADKTPAQLEAQAKAARRMAQPNTSAQGQPAAAHQFIAAEGGLSQSLRNDMGVQDNPRIGNRRLYAGAGKGLTLEQATEKLTEAGYLQDGASHSDALALIRRSLSAPQFTPEGTERIAEADKQSRLESHQAEQDAIAEVEGLEENEAAALYAPNAEWVSIPVDSDTVLNGGSNTSTEAAMRALGFTEQEIQDAITNESRISEATGKSSRSADEGTASQTQGNSDERVKATSTDQAGRSQDEGLTAPTRADVLAQQERTDTAEKAAQAKRRTDDEQARKDQERKDIAARSQAAADTFELGGDAEQNLSGQGDIFGQQEQSTTASNATKDIAKTAEKPDALKERETAAKVKMLGAAAKLAELLSKSTRMNITPEQEQKMLPIVIELFDGAMELGHVKFKQAARYVREFLTNAIDQDAADSIPMDTLQGAYIATARRHSDKAITSKKDVISVETLADLADAAEEAANQAKENSNVPSPNIRVERDSAQRAAKPALGDTVSPGPLGTDEATAEAGGRADREAGSRQQDGSSVPFGSAPVTGERSDQRVHSGIGQPEFESIVTGTDFSEPSGDAGIAGVPAEPIPASDVVATANESPKGLKAIVERNRAAKVPVKLADLANIAETLPRLLDGQRADVQLAEKRFAKPDGYGMLFTNGTGTGKTFSGLGVVKRFDLQGKSNTLITVPDSKIASDWIESGKLLGLNINELADTKDAGKGITITTYANLGENDQLAKRAWDLVVADEAHTLMQSADGAATGYLQNLRAITMHPDGVYQRHSMLHRELLDGIAALREEGNALGRLDGTSAPEDHAKAKDIQRRMDALMVKMRETQDAVKADVQAKQGAARTRLVALSATPFAYEKTIDWANGYLFDYNDGQPSEEGVSRGYNAGDNRERYFMQHFGYTMRYNKLTQPDAKVDRGLMQRQWNGQLKKSGALSGRMLDVKPDYDRRFILVNSAIGNRIDEALQWVSDQRQASGKVENGFSLLSDAINEKFKYLEKRYLLEAIKATEVIPIVKQHMAMGRKVVVFHDYKKGGGFNPFHINGANPKLRAAAAAFNAQFSDLVNAPLGSMPSPIEVFKRELPEVLLVNGDEKQKDLLARYKSFQDDSTGPQVMLVQSAKNKGWSGHDTTGKHQRVLINLGQPTAPTLAIQQEGRIYRTGQASDAIMRYMNTGTNWERWTFATTIASRASTAENLGMGEMARALKDSFIQSFEESDTYAPGHADEGKGGKARDQAANNAVTEYDRAKTMYWATQKKNSRTKAQEGTDYFATPEPVGFKMVEWLDARSGEDTLEPSGGHGAIARWLPDTTKRTVVEPSLALRSRLAMVMNPTEDRIIPGNFEDLGVVNKYDGIVMNPPFGMGGKTAVDHIAKAATHLRDGGRIVALLPTGPAADKKFEKWLYEKSERAVKPLYTHPSLGAIYKGDTVTTRAPGIPEGIVEGFKPENLAARQPANVMVKVPGKPGTTGIWVDLLMSKESTGKRVEEYSPAADLHMVANITMPQVTFERAGTGVATRIVVLEKQSDKAMPTIMQRNRDLSGITDINELFNNLEDMKFPPRAKVAESAPAEAPKAEKVEKATVAQKADVGDLISLGGRETFEVTTYTTNAGKELRGVWVPTRAMALQYGPSTFEKRGLGFFVRERDFPKVDGPAFSLQDQGSQRAGLPIEAVQSAADAITANWANSPEVIVAQDLRDQKIPEQVRVHDAEQQSQGASGEPEGFFYRGKVYLLASQLHSNADVSRVLFHESLGHFGLRGAFGNALQPILQQISAVRGKEVADKASDYGLDMSDPKQRMVAAEEVLAEWAQTRPELGFVKRAIAAVRTWLRANVPGFAKLKVTDDEILRNYILPARGWVERGTKASKPSAVPAFSRSSVEPSQDDAMYSRATNDPRAYQEKAAQAVSDLFSAPGTVNWWHKTVGTMHNLAKRSPQFGKVFDSVQNFLGDVSALASEAADKAPTLIPKLESWRDIGKSPIDAADTKAIAAPIFEGTLSWTRDADGKAVQAKPGEDETPAGIVFTDGELKSLFKLTPEQIKLYREFRAATDQSLNKLAATEFLRYGGKDVEALRAMVMDAPTADDAATLLEQHLEAMANDAPGRAEALRATAQVIREKADKIQGLIDRGYAPLSRFGHYTVDVLDEHGERAYFGMFESKAEANRMARRMRENYAKGVITQGTVSEQAYKMFSGITPETLELFGEMVGLESTGDSAQDQMFQQYLKLAKANRSAMKRLIHRQGIAGFSEDAGRVLAGFVYSNARLASTNLHTGTINEAAAAIPKTEGELKDMAIKLADYVRNPQEEAQALRGLMFAQYIGGSLASAVVNMTQPMAVTMPYLSQWGGAAKAAGQMRAALADVLKKSTGDAKLDAALKKAEEEGIVAPQEVHHLMAQAQGRGALRSGDGTTMGNLQAKAANFTSKLSLAWGKPFAVAEQFNRRVTFIAAWRTAIAANVANPAKFAEEAIRETQFVYNKGNKPQWARGAIGGTLFTFKQYSVSYMELLQRMYQSGPEGKKAALFALGMLFLMGGASGLPFVGDAEDVVDGVMQRLGYSFSSKQARRQFFADVLGTGAADFVERGISGLPGVPIDVAGRMGLGNLIPGTGLLTKKADYGQDVAELLGPAGDMAKRAFQGAGLAVGGDVGGALAMMSGSAVRNAKQGLDMYQTGMYRDQKGRKVIDVDGYDALIKAIGFQPNAVAQVQSAIGTQQNLIAQNRMMKSDLADEMAAAVYEQDADKQKEVRERMIDWNRKNPSSPVSIDMAGVRRRVIAMRQSKADRVSKSAPSAIRASVKQAITEGAV